ncbi:MAG TPA: hypothetical protein VF306_05375, partial [Pirellulales bacterium]
VSQAAVAVPARLPAPPSPEEIAGPHLKWAEREAARLLDEHLRQIDEFFDHTSRHTPEFAERALSWGSKWRLVADHLPFTKGDRHRAFIRAQFEQHLFTPAQLSDLVEQVVASHLAHLDSLESEMLVRIRTDVADFPEAYPIAQLDQSSLDAQYDEALAQVLTAAASSVRSDVGTLLVSEIAGEVLTQVALKLGVSAGILTTGAASSWATFGVGLVVGLIVDQIVSWVWDRYADPVGSLSSQLDRKLDEMRGLIVEGSDDVQGLRWRLETYADERARVREAAVLAILRETSKE